MRPAGLDLSCVTSLLSVVVGDRLLRRHRLRLRRDPAQTQLQEDLPEDVRGRVFGVLNMLVSVASFLPILIVGPLSTLTGTTVVIFALAIAVVVIGLVSVLTRGPLAASDARPASDPNAPDPIASALGADQPLGPEPPFGVDPLRTADRPADPDPGARRPDRPA